MFVLEGADGQSKQEAPKLPSSAECRWEAADCAEKLCSSANRQLMFTAMRGCRS